MDPEPPKLPAPPPPVAGKRAALVLELLRPYRGTLAIILLAMLSRP